MEPKNENYSGVERRQFPRLPASVVDYARIEVSIDGSTKEKTSFAKDVSVGGVCIFISEKVEIGDLLSLKIYLPEHKRSIDAVGRVAWVKKSPLLNPKDEHYDVGVQLVKIEESEREKLQEYTKKFHKDSQTQTP